MVYSCVFVAISLFNSLLVYVVVFVLSKGFLVGIVGCVGLMLFGCMSVYVGFCVFEFWRNNRVWNVANVEPV